MAQLYGSRFLPPPSLRDRASRGEFAACGLMLSIWNR